MNRTKIEWADYSWNPIRGLCPEDCKLPDGKSYCYGRRLYQRFRMNPRLRLSKREVFCDMPTKPGARIFVCSTMELFHPKVMPGWRDTVITRIALNPQHTFIILTKRPELIDRPMPDNVWLGVSVTGNSIWEIYRTAALAKARARVKFVSFEPILGSSWALSAMPLRANWNIAGRLTGHGKIHDPARSTIEAIVEYGKVNDISVFLKDNLKDIWGGSLLQEYPALAEKEKTDVVL